VARILVVHLELSEAARLAERLRREGFEAQAFSPRPAAALHALRENPPDAVLIDLTRMPSYGRYVGSELRGYKGTRGIPLVFLNGEAEKTEIVRRLLPDAVFTNWTGVAAAIAKAIRRTGAAPASPNYGSIPAARKLGIVGASVVALLHAPEGFQLPLPEGARIQTRPPGATVLLAFARSVAALGREMPALERHIEEGVRVWVLWPKKASGQAGDLSATHIVEMCKSVGLSAYKTCAVDDVWSAVAVSRSRRRARMAPTRV
jgi:CheY-like chemotaxis protein